MSVVKNRLSKSALTKEQKQRILGKVARAEVNSLGKPVFLNDRILFLGKSRNWKFSLKDVQRLCILAKQNPKAFAEALGIQDKSASREVKRLGLPARSISSMQVGRFASALGEHAGLFAKTLARTKDGTRLFVQGLNGSELSWFIGGLKEQILGFTKELGPTTGDFASGLTNDSAVRFASALTPGTAELFAEGLGQNAVAFFRGLSVSVAFFANGLNPVKAKGFRKGLNKTKQTVAVYNDLKARGISREIRSALTGSY